MFEARKSSSAANNYLYGRLMVDCGVPAKDIDVSEFDACIITHGHGDHMNVPAVKKIIDAGIPVYASKKYKRVRSKTVFAKLPKEYRDQIEYIDVGEEIRIETLDIDDIVFWQVAEVPHDVPNHAYHIEIGDWKAFHVTDCGTIDHIEFEHFYDHMTIESNYCEVKLNNMISRDQQKRRYSRYTRSMTTHHSVQQCMTAFKRRKHKWGKKTVLFEAHKSATAYSKKAYQAAEKKRLDRKRRLNERN